MSQSIQISRFSPHFKKRWRERVGCMTTVQKLNRRIKEKPAHWVSGKDYRGRRNKIVLVRFGDFTVVVQPGSWVAVTVY